MLEKPSESNKLSGSEFEVLTRANLAQPRRTLQILRMNLEALLSLKKPEKTVPLPETMSRLTMSKKGDRLTAVGASGKLHILDADSANILTSIDPEKSSIKKVRWSPDDQLISGFMSYGNSLCPYRIGVWDAKNGKKISTIGDVNHANYRRNEFIDHTFFDERYLAVARLTNRTNFGYGLIDLYDISSGKKVEEISPAAYDSPFNVDIAMIPIIVEAKGADEPHRHNESADPRLRNIRFPSYSFGAHSYTGEFFFHDAPVITSPDGSKIAMHSFTDDIVHIRNTGDRASRKIKIQNHPSYEKRSWTFSISNEGNLAAAFGNQVYVWSPADGTVISDNDFAYFLESKKVSTHLYRECFYPDKKLYDLMFASDGSLLTVGADQQMKFWRLNHPALKVQGLADTN